MVAVNGIYRFTVDGIVQGQQHLHNLHFRSTSSGSAVGADEPTYMQGLINYWKAQCRAIYLGCFATVDTPNLTYRVRKVCGSVPLPAGVDSPESAGSQAGTRPTTGLGDAMAPWLSEVTTVRTEFAGRRYRGRFYLGGLYESDLIGAVIQTSRGSLVQAYADVLRTTFITPIESTVDEKLFVFSPTLAAVAGTQCQAAGGDAISLQPRTYLCTTKSRKAGHGN